MTRSGTLRWIERLSRNADGLRVAVLNGQIKPTHPGDGLLGCLCAA